MKNTSLRIVTFGVFDMFHFGHLNLFINIKNKFGSDCFLIVCVQDEKDILKYKPESKILYSTQERVNIIKSIRYVDDVKIYNDVDKDIKELDFDVLITGADQNHQGFKKAVEYCKNNNKKVYTFQRTEGISSSFIKDILPDK